MPLTKTERETIENIIKRLKKERAGCAKPFPGLDANEEFQAKGYEGIARIYIDTWLIGPLELLLSDEPHDKYLARDMSR